MVRRAMLGMLYADNARVVSTSPSGIIRMIDVISVVYQDLGLTMSDKKTEAMHLWSDSNTASIAPRIVALGGLSC